MTIILEKETAIHKKIRTIVEKHIFEKAKCLKIEADPDAVSAEGNKIANEILGVAAMATEAAIGIIDANINLGEVDMIHPCGPKLSDHIHNKIVAALVQASTGVHLHLVTSEGKEN